MASSPKNIEEMPIERAAQPAPVLDETVEARLAAEELGRSASRCVLVTRAGTRELIGVITVSDLAKLATAKTAGDLATRNVVAIFDDATVGDAIALLMGQNSRRMELNMLPIVTSRKEAFGVVTRERINWLSATMRGAESKSSGISFA